LGRRNSRCGDVAGTGRAQGSGGFHEGGSRGQYVIDQKSGHPQDAGPRSPLDIHRALKVVGSMAVVEPGLVSDPAAKPQGRRKDELTSGKTHLANGFTSQQLERRIAASADGSRRGRDRNDEHRPVA
jgi:hypothetical protein